MPRRPATVIVGPLVAFCLAVPAMAQERTVQRSFANGGTVHLDLSVGEYRITDSSDDRIRIAWLTANPKDAERVNVRININMFGTRADVKISGPKNGLKVDVELPRRSNLVAELLGGTLHMSGVEGSKNISAQAGELDIEVGGREGYRLVNASVGSGALAAPAFKQDKIDARSFEWTGAGSYELKVRVAVGQVTLRD
jgi:hypothetical protein